MSDLNPPGEKPTAEKEPEPRSPRPPIDLGGLDPIKGLEELGRLGREVGEPAAKLAGHLVRRSLSSDANILEQTLRTAQAMGQLAGQLAPKELTEALGQVSALADQIRREAVDPALGLADLVGDCLDGLDVLVATSAIPLPVELEEARLTLARLRRPVLKLDIALPAERGTPAMAGRLIRTLVEGSEDLGEAPRDLDALEMGVAEAVRGAVERTRQFDPRKPIEIRARLHADLLDLDVVDQGAGGLTPATAIVPAWDVKVVRRVMDEVGYEPAPQGGTLHLSRRLASWRVRRAMS